MVLYICSWAYIFDMYFHKVAIYSYYILVISEILLSKLGLWPDYVLSGYPARRLQNLVQKRVLESAFFDRVKSGWVIRATRQPVCTTAFALRCTNAIMQPRKKERYSWESGGATIKDTS